MSTVKRVLRLDRGELLKRPTVTQEGFLRLDGKIARTGIQVYHRADGTEVRELRPSSEVFNQAYLDSFAAIPLTNTHPARLLDDQTASKHAVGAVAGARRLDEQWVGGSFTIWDAQAIEAVRGGRTQLSVGYTAEVVDEPGEYEGERYDCIQRNITANHLSLVDRARAGNEARARLDDSGNCVEDSHFRSSEDSVLPSSKETAPMAHKFKLDGFEIELADANAEAVILRAIENARKDEAAKFADAVKVAQAKLDAADAKGKMDAEAIETLKASIPGEALKLADVMDTARKVLGDNFKLEGGPDQWRKSVIKHIIPSLSERADAADAKELGAFWECALASLPKESAVDKARATQAPPAAHHDSTDPGAARARMVERERAAFVK